MATDAVALQFFVDDARDVVHLVEGHFTLMRVEVENRDLCGVVAREDRREAHRRPLRKVSPQVRWFQSFAPGPRAVGGFLPDATLPTVLRERDERLEARIGSFAARNRRVMQ